jgi:hypothetical protein
MKVTRKKTNQMFDLWISGKISDEKYQSFMNKASKPIHKVKILLE